MAPRVRLGELLVEAQIITRAQLDEILAIQQRDPRRLGTLLVEAGLITETQVTQILSQQLSVPWVSLYHIDFSRQLLNLVPREVAEKYCLVPIFVRRVRGLGDTLYIAMDDPSDEAAQREVAQFSGLPVRTMIAPPSDIKAALRAYYGTLRPPEEGAPVQVPAPARAASFEVPGRGADAVRAAPRPAVLPPEPAAPAPEPPAAPAPAAPAAPVTAPPAQPTGDRVSETEIESREASMPKPRRGSVPRMITLTMLDGTRIRLPAKARADSPAASEEEQLTARDLVAALRAAAHGADTDDILGDNKRWEKLFAALLALLMKKHLIADWEFIEELKRI